MKQKAAGVGDRCDNQRCSQEAVAGSTAAPTAGSDDKQDQVADGGDGKVQKNGEGKADGDESDANAKLPPLEQPDENDRPKEDPQLDTALLVMRIMLLGADFPTLANAETVPSTEVARP